MAAEGGWFEGLTKMVRTKVSADKKRFQDGGFDLDLTYITDRIIGSLRFLLNLLFVSF